LEGQWEEVLLKSQLPDLSLEDKAVFVIRGDDGKSTGPIHGEDDVLANENEVGLKVWRVEIFSSHPP
jgi:hypothetical protein